MDLNKIKELITLVEQAGITGLVVEEGSLKIEIKNEPQQTMSYTLPAALPAQNAVLPAAKISSEKGEASAGEEQTGLLPIKSPMTGTFYAAPNPESPAFVSKGTSVEVGQPVCIIEAMKTFNEIEAEISGTIEKVMVKNQQVVEEGQVLFLVRP